MQDALAHKIAENLLIRTRLEYFGGDRAVFAQGFHTPQKVETFAGERILDTAEDVLVLHDMLCLHFEKLGATDYVRRVLAAEFKGANIIHSTHVSRVLNKETLLQEPFVAFSVVMKSREGWQVANCSYAIADADNHVRVLSGTR